MLIGQLKRLLNSLPPECDNMPALIATCVNCQRSFDLIVHFGILPSEPPGAVFIGKTEYDRLVSENKAETYPDYEPPKSDILPGDEWKLG